MKVALVGKGGSGKTTLTGLLARQLAITSPVLAIDADINQHLGQSLGLSQVEAMAIPGLGLDIKRIAAYLQGDNPRFTPQQMIKTTPPGNGSQLLYLNQDNPLFDHFKRQVNGVNLMVVGALEDKDLGVACYHSKTGSVELILNHLIDGPGEYILVDMTAGVDIFASGLFTRFDLTLLVVEPTLKSVGVYKQYKDYAKEYKVELKVVANKVRRPQDLDFVQTHCGSDLLTGLTESDFIRATEQGQILPISKLETANAQALEAIIQAIDNQKQDWVKFYNQALEFHRKNALSWANHDFGLDLTEQIDPDFSLARVVADNS